MPPHPEFVRSGYDAQGVIKKLVLDRGFGFIATDHDGAKREEIFFHHSTVEGGQFDDLHEGQAVESLKST